MRSQIFLRLLLLFTKVKSAFYSKEHNYCGESWKVFRLAEGRPSWILWQCRFSDLFFPKGINIIRQEGNYRLIATNTIAQGDTRSKGLRFICQNGSLIYNATRCYKWPGLAAVVMSVVHIIKVQFIPEQIQVKDFAPTKQAMVSTARYRLIP